MKKKILFLIYQLVGGGAEKKTVDIVNHIDSSLYEVTVMTVIDCSSDAHVLKSHIKYDFIFNGKMKEDRLFFKLFYWASPQFLHKLLIQGKYDIEIAALEGIPAKIISGCSENNTKKIAFLHADATNMAWPSKRYKNYQQEYESYNSFDRLIFVSRSTQRRFIERFSIDHKKTSVIYNPFDFNQIKYKSHEKIDDYKKTSNFLFCAVGRLDKVKGFDRLIEAFHIVYKKYNNISLVIIGEGKDQALLSQLIEKYKLKKEIILLGYRTNPYKYLKMSDCYICSSHSEGLSSTVIEAMILNKPIITTDCGGMDELLEDYQKGLIINNLTSGLVEGMTHFLNSYSKENDFVSLLETNNLQRFTYDNYFNEIKKIM